MSLAGPVRRESRIVLLLCALAAARVLVFSAGFPFFGNIDEQSHYDLVHKYARGHVPRGLEPFDAEVVRAIVLYGSPEYSAPAGAAVPPPGWTLPVGALPTNLETYADLARGRTNHESTQPPLYYAVAALWHGLGRLLGLPGGQLLYSIRFLNVLSCALLTWLAYLFAGRFFPEDRFVRLGVPLLVAFFPQDVWYCVNNDVLLALVTGAALLGLLVLWRGDDRSTLYHASAGLLVAASLLVKQTSVGILGIAVWVAGHRILGSAREQSASAPARKMAVLLFAAVLPIAAWSLRNHLVLGDFTGSAIKARYLGWSPKPWTAIADHPLFTPRGMAVFWHETLASFWRGESIWSGRRIASEGWDRFYSTSSLVLLGAATVRAWRSGTPVEERSTLRACLILFALSIGFLAAISVLFDFGACVYPSRAHPYMSSGRLATAALIPFAMLYVHGLSVVLPGRRVAPLRWGTLVAVVALMTLSELRLSSPAFASAFNWFHLVGRE